MWKWIKRFWRKLRGDQIAHPVRPDLVNTDEDGTVKLKPGVDFREDENGL